MSLMLVVFCSAIISSGLASSRPSVEEGNDTEASTNHSRRRCSKESCSQSQLFGNVSVALPCFQYLLLSDLFRVACCFIEILSNFKHRCSQRIGPTSCSARSETAKEKSAWVQGGPCCREPATGLDRSLAPREQLHDLMPTLQRPNSSSSPNS